MSDADLDADDQQVEVESENEGDRPGSREVTPAAMRGPAEGEAHSPGEVESSFPDLELGPITGVFEPPPPHATYQPPNHTPSTDTGAESQGA